MLFVCTFVLHPRLSFIYVSLDNLVFSRSDLGPANNCKEVK